MHLPQGCADQADDLIMMMQSLLAGRKANREDDYRGNILLCLLHTCSETRATHCLQVSEAIREGAEGFFSTQVQPYLPCSAHAKG